MIELQANSLYFKFPSVHPHAVCSVSFIRTLRIPDDGREYPLPPGFTSFPLHHVGDYASRLPEAWSAQGGVFLPMYQAEALWISFSGNYPIALKVAAGKTCALTGEPWHDRLTPAPLIGGPTRIRNWFEDRFGTAVPSSSGQDYMVIPDQPWLDGFFAGKGLIRQFVAMPLGEGYTADEQLTGHADHDGLQISACPMKAEEYERLRRDRGRRQYQVADEVQYRRTSRVGLAPGGLMRQEIFRDRFGIGVWDQSAKSRCVAHILNSVEYFRVTQQKPPTKPPTAAAYEQAGLPWFEYYGVELQALESPNKLLNLKSIAELMKEKGQDALPGNESLKPGTVIPLSQQPSLVKEGGF